MVPLDILNGVSSLWVSSKEAVQFCGQVSQKQPCLKCFKIVVGVLIRRSHTTIVQEFYAEASDCLAAYQQATTEVGFPELHLHIQPIPSSPKRTQNLLVSLDFFWSGMPQLGLSPNDIAASET